MKKKKTCYFNMFNFILLMKNNFNMICLIWIVYYMLSPLLHFIRIHII